MKITQLAFAGGGIYGISELAALNELLKYNDIIDIQSMCGSSVGALISCLWCVGYSTKELKKIMFELDFESLIKDSNIPYINLYERFGMFEAKKLEDTIEKLIENKTQRKFCTFAQIDKDLTIVATNINLQKPFFFNRTTSPKLALSKAVRMSISYPIIMMPVLYENDLFGDAGEFINFPISYFSDMSKTIGITFSAHNENSDGTLKSRTNISNFIEYVTSIGTTLSRSSYLAQFTKKYMERTIIIQIEEPIYSTQFNISDIQKKALYNMGKNAVKNQLNNIIKMKP